MPNERRKFIVSCTILLLFTLPLWIFMENWISYTNEYNDNNLIGKPLPRTEISSIDSNNVELHRLRDTLIVLDAWSTNCGSCIKSFIHFSELMNYYKDKPVKFYTLNIPIRRDSINRTRNIIMKYFNSNNLIASNDAVKILNIKGVPELIIIKNDTVLWKGYTSLKRDVFITDIYDRIEKELNITSVP